MQSKQSSASPSGSCHRSMSLPGVPAGWPNASQWPAAAAKSPGTTPAWLHDGRLLCDGVHAEDAAAARLPQRRKPCRPQPTLTRRHQAATDACPHMCVHRCCPQMCVHRCVSTEAAALSTILLTARTWLWGASSRLEALVVTSAGIPAVRRLAASASTRQDSW